jgi:hypothetical protein
LLFIVIIVVVAVAVVVLVVVVVVVVVSYAWFRTSSFQSILMRLRFPAVRTARSRCRCVPFACCLWSASLLTAGTWSRVP